MTSMQVLYMPIKGYLALCLRPQIPFSNTAYNEGKPHANFN